MKKIKYRACKYLLIKKVEIEKETDKCIWINAYGSTSRKYLKNSDGVYNFFDTWQEAKDHLVSKAQLEVNGLKSRLNTANAYLEKMKGLKDDT